ncbi:hypothetical protein A5644_25815 [Mycobacterium intracellulare subsp. yongonense]|nr:hypothetical protein A5644_25815 [Mycobacterium intracellulare subsp. yongonense]
MGLTGVVEYLSKAGFIFQPWQVATFVTALRTKPFLILAGISGTGKTRLPRLVAEATGAKSEVVPVRPDWTDSSDLLGYERLTGDFVPGKLLRLCEEAMRNPTTQYFFVLDEMNIARVEYYFAEVLSVMESRRRGPDGAIISDALNLTAPDQSSSDPPGPDWSTVYLPANVSIIGTVNMDETTHGFSRKVLDRAFVLELSEVDLSEYSSVSEPRPIGSSWSSSVWAPQYLSLSDVPDPQTNSVIVDAVNALVRANESLQPAQLQVGFRVRDEVALFCLNAAGTQEHFVDGGQSAIDPLDLCLSMKLLPRLQGGGILLREVLSDLETWTAARGDESMDLETPSGFRRTHDRVRIMQQRLTQTGFTSYWV